jgi:hypothetical protein
MRIFCSSRVVVVVLDWVAAVVLVVIFIVKMF